MALPQKIVCHGLKLPKQYANNRPLCHLCWGGRLFTRVHILFDAYAAKTCFPKDRHELRLKASFTHSLWGYRGIPTLSKNPRSIRPDWAGIIQSEHSLPACYITFPLTPYPRWEH
jgi:hypothetical protein